jgi:hypothetical protein
MLLGFAHDPLLNNRNAIMTAMVPCFEDMDASEESPLDSEVLVVAAASSFPLFSGEQIVWKPLIDQMKTGNTWEARMKQVGDERYALKVADKFELACGTTVTWRSLMRSLLVLLS